MTSLPGKDWRKKEMLLFLKAIRSIPDAIVTTSFPNDLPSFVMQSIPNPMKFALGFPSYCSTVQVNIVNVKIQRTSSASSRTSIQRRETCVCILMNLCFEARRTNGCLKSTASCRLWLTEADLFIDSFIKKKKKFFTQISINGIHISIC